MVAWRSRREVAEKVRAAGDPLLRFQIHQQKGGLTYRDRAGAEYVVQRNLYRRPT